MLGGSFWIAFLRNAISTVLMLSFFMMLDRPRFSMKKTAWCYIIFGFSMIFFLASAGVADPPRSRSACNNGINHLRNYALEVFLPFSTDFS